MGEDFLTRWERQFGLTVDDLRRLISFACRGLGSEEKEDACQEILLRLMQRFRSSDPPRLEMRDQLRAYVYRCAVNYRKARLAKRARTPETIASDLRSFPEVAKKPVSQSEEQSREEAWEALTPEQREQFLSILPDDDRRLRDVMCLWLGGLTYAQIVEQLGVGSLATMHRRIMAAREYIERRISEVTEP